VSAYTDNAKRERIKKRIMAGSDGGRPGQWTARKAQRLAQEYKKAGGGYTGPKTKKQRSLSKWTKQNWRTSDGSKSEGKKRYLPDKAWKNMTAAEKRATNRAKAKGNREGKQFVPQPKKIAKKTKRYRSG
tara:strand:+ start:732 stop:1121 length:390 start_codon:yes stop_codon:yes gene_type:complete